MGTKFTIAVDLDEIVDLREQIDNLKVKLAKAEAEASRYRAMYLDLYSTILGVADKFPAK